MWRQCKQTYRYTVFTGVTVAVMSMFVACNFGGPHIVPDTPEGIHDVLNSAPYTNLTQSQRATYVEVPELLKVQHGLGCAQASKAAERDYVGLRIRDMAVIPPGSNTGTVFLNGWRLEYQNEGHPVRGLGSAIFNITQTQNGTQQELHWEAGGVISDDYGEHPYEWCYIYYTLVFWYRNPSTVYAGFWPEVAAVPLQTDDNPAALTFVHKTGYDPNYNTARRQLPGAVSVPKALPRAVLPRGFGLTWGGRTDHHLLQAGFDLGTPVPSGNTISWTSTTLWKDNDSLDYYYGAEIVSVLSGQGVQMSYPTTVLRLSEGLGHWVQQSNTVPLTPRGPEGFGCVGGEELTETQYSVQNVPFDYAVPVLTGWQLEYPCTDHHVKKIGVWIKGFSYVKAPGATTGTLLYTIVSTLADDAFFGNHGGIAWYKVSVLGLNRGGVLPPTSTGSTGTSALLAEPLELSQ